MITRLLNLLFPPQCINCDTRVPMHGTLCIPCWQKIQFISDPMCHCCGLPFDYEIGNEALCGACLFERPPYAKARAAFRYDEHSKRLVTRFKYSDQTHLAHVYSAWLAKAAGEMIMQTDIIIPVPLHYFRFVNRRFNQSALLAHALSKKTKIKHMQSILKRKRNTISQTGLTRKQREKNVKGAFSMSSRAKKIIKGKNILLVDDVMTTGSTIEQCAKILLKGGAMQVNVLTLARAIR